jgi:D-alanyl-D-alanine carboxypeptidase
MRRIRKGVAVVGACLLIAGCGSTQGEEGATGSPSAFGVELNESPVSEEDAANLDLLLGNLAKNSAEQFPALWVGAWDTERGAYVRAWGEAEVGGAAATTEDVFRIGSVTKTVTATLILQLVDQGELGLQDTVAAAAPNVAEQHPEVAELTIAQLVGMASGLPDYMNVPDGIVAGITQDPSTVWTADELIDAGIAGGVQPAGTAGYSTTNYIVLQQIAESKTGSPIPELIAEQITGPLGMSSSALPPNDNTALPAPATHGYLNTQCAQEVAADGGSAPAGQDTSDWNASYGQGGGGMYATLTDLGRWGAAELGSALLSEQSANERLKYTTLPEGVDYGLGVMDYGDGFVGHSGEALGWQAQVAHNPTTGLTVAMATNACAGADSAMFETVRGLLAYTLTPPEGAS